MWYFCVVAPNHAWHRPHRQMASLGEEPMPCLRITSVFLHDEGYVTFEILNIEVHLMPQ